MSDDFKPFWTSVDTQRALLRLQAAKLEALKAEVLAELNRDLFADGAGKPPVPLMWRQRLTRLRARVRTYLVTLWRAVKGEDLYDEDDY